MARQRTTTPPTGNARKPKATADRSGGTRGAKPGGATANGATAVKKPAWYRQLWQVYSLTRRYDRGVSWWLLGGFLLAGGASFVAAFFIGGQGVLALVLGAVLSVLIGVLVALIVLARRADKALFAQVEGQPGATSYALQQIRRGWRVEQEPVAVDPKSRDLVFRAIGRPGIVLLTEGPLPRVLRLAEAERKRHSRLASGAPVHVIHVGSGEDQVELRKVRGRMARLPRALTSAEVTTVAKRVSALSAIRAPIPKGIDPYRARPDRKATRGR